MSHLILEITESCILLRIFGAKKILVSKKVPLREAFAITGRESFKRERVEWTKKKQLKGTKLKYVTGGRSWLLKFNKQKFSIQNAIKNPVTVLTSESQLLVLFKSYGSA